MSADIHRRREQLAEIIALRLNRGDEASAVLDDLVRDEGAIYRFYGDAHKLRLAGLTSSCTVNVKGLLYNWRTNAVKRGMARAFA